MTHKRHFQCIHYWLFVIIVNAKECFLYVPYSSNFLYLQSTMNLPKNKRKMFVHPFCKSTKVAFGKYIPSLKNPQLSQQSEMIVISGTIHVFILSPDDILEKAPQNLFCCSLKIPKANLLPIVLPLWHLFCQTWLHQLFS